MAQQDWSTVGKPVRKKDAMALLLGKPAYLDDLTPKDCLVVKVLRSPHAHALIEEIGQQIEQSLSGSTLGDIAQEDHSGDTRKLDTLHGFPVSKKFEDLQFGRNYDPKKR